MTSYYPGLAPIDAYGNGGFRFAGMSHRGALLLLPSGIYAWAGAGPNSGLALLEKAMNERAAIDMVIFGTGERHILPPSSVMRAFEAEGLAFDTMTTGAAVRTWNVLLAEGRRAAAALLPVEAGA